jgi:ornithine cyclodeaminase/alanine dehydrogenase-like protein (mu-crystallin family)
VKFSSGRVHRVQDESNYTQAQIVLEPFKALYAVRRAQVSGVSDEYAEALAKSMMGQRGELPV